MTLKLLTLKSSELDRTLLIDQWTTGLRVQSFIESRSSLTQQDVESFEDPVIRLILSAENPLRTVGQLLGYLNLGALEQGFSFDMNSVVDDRDSQPQIQIESYMYELDTVWYQRYLRSQYHILNLQMKTCYPLAQSFLSNEPKTDLKTIKDKLNYQLVLDRFFVKF